jgi:hypothetical protein
MALLGHQEVGLICYQLFSMRAKFSFDEDIAILKKS